MELLELIVLIELIELKFIQDADVIKIELIEPNLQILLI